LSKKRLTDLPAIAAGRGITDLGAGEKRGTHWRRTSPDGVLKGESDFARLTQGKKQHEPPIRPWTSKERPLVREGELGLRYELGNIYRKKRGKGVKEI